MAALLGKLCCHVSKQRLYFSTNSHEMSISSCTRCKLCHRSITRQQDKWESFHTAMRHAAVPLKMGKLWMTGAQVHFSLVLCSQ